MRLFFGVGVFIFCGVNRLFSNTGLEHLLKVAYPILESNTALLKALGGWLERGFSPGRGLVRALSRLDEQTTVKGLLSEGDSWVLEACFWAGCKQSWST